MMKRIKGPAAIVAPHVIYGIPKKIKLIIQDHISYSHTDTDIFVQKIKNENIKKFHNKKDMFTRIGAFIPLLPFCDIIFYSK